jgi:hypothetical protein
VTLEKNTSSTTTCNQGIFRIIKIITLPRREVRLIEIPNLTIEEPRQIKTPKKLADILKLDKIRIKILHLPEST